MKLNGTKLIYVLFFLIIFSTISFALNETYISSQLTFDIDFDKSDEEKNPAKDFKQLKGSLLKEIVGKKRSRFILNFVGNTAKKFTSDQEILLSFDVENFNPNRTEIIHTNNQTGYKLFDVFWYSPVITYYYEYEGIRDASTIGGFNIHLGVFGAAFVEDIGHFGVTGKYIYPAKFYYDKPAEHNPIYTKKIENKAYLILGGWDNVSINYYLMLPNETSISSSSNINGNVNVAGSLFETIVPKFLYPFDKYKLRFTICTPYNAFADLKIKEQNNFEVILDNGLWKNWKSITTTNCGNYELTTLTLKRKNTLAFIIGMLIPFLSLIALLWENNLKKRYLAYIVTFLGIIVFTFPVDDISQFYPLRVFLLLINFIIIFFIEIKINRDLRNWIKEKINRHMKFFNLLSLFAVFFFSINLIYLFFKEEYISAIFNVIGIVILLPPIILTKRIKIPAIITNPIHRIIIFIIYLIVAKVFLYLVFLNSNFFFIF